jgi:hypothetical protein
VPVVDASVRALPAATGDRLVLLSKQSGLMHELRLVAAQRAFLCQVCGLAVDPARAAAVVGADGRCLTSAPLHPGECTALAQRWCPAVSRRGTVVEFARGQHHADGPATPDYGFAQAWRLPADMPGDPAPDAECPIARTADR